MEIIETPVFTERIVWILDDHEYRLLQSVLITNPAAGVLIPGSRGLRKLRWMTGQKGKRGGIRIIYYWYFSKSIILMLFVYKKSVAADLTKKQLKALSEHVKGGVL